MSDKPKPGMVAAIDELASRAKQPPQLPPPSAELFLHASQCEVTRFPDGTLVLQFTLPFGLRVSVPFDEASWGQLKAAAGSVHIARQVP